MLKLHGFSSSNYYNAAKLALLEKEIEFEEVLIYTGANEHDRPEYLEKSPLGKVPCLETEQGSSPSRAASSTIWSTPIQRIPLSRRHFARAKLLELTQISISTRAPCAPASSQLLRQERSAASIANDVRDVLAKGRSARASRAVRQLCARRSVYSSDVSCVCTSDGPARRALGVKDDPLAAVPGSTYLSRMEAAGPYKASRRPERQLPGVHRAYPKAFGARTDGCTASILAPIRCRCAFVRGGLSCDHTNRHIAIAGFAASQSERSTCFLSAYRSLTTGQNEVTVRVCSVQSNCVSIFRIDAARDQRVDQFLRAPKPACSFTCIHRCSRRSRVG